MHDTNIHLDSRVELRVILKVEYKSCLCRNPIEFNSYLCLLTSVYLFRSQICIFEFKPNCFTLDVAVFRSGRTYYKKKGTFVSCFTWMFIFGLLRRVRRPVAECGDSMVTGWFVLLQTSARDKRVQTKRFNI